MSFDEAWRVAEAGSRLTNAENATRGADGRLTHYDGDLLLEMARNLVIADPLAPVVQQAGWTQPDLSPTTSVNSRRLGIALGLTNDEGTLAAHHVVESTG